MKNIKKFNDPVDKKFDISDFKPYQISGFSLDGYLLGGKNGEFIKDFPKEISCNGVTYTLEDVEYFSDDFFNAHYC